MKDGMADPADSSQYECLDCGKIVVATAHPGVVFRMWSGSA